MFSKLMCKLGHHQGTCYDGAYRCNSCSYTEGYGRTEVVDVKDQLARVAKYYKESPSVTKLRMFIKDQDRTIETKCDEIVELKIEIKRLATGWRLANEELLHFRVDKR